MKKISSSLLFLSAVPALFAAGVMPSGMTSLAESILEIFTGTFMKIVFAIFLCGAAVAYAFNKDNEKIKRSAIAIGIGSAIVIGASGIVGAIWSASAG